jgi:hypothetical protein
MRVDALGSARTGDEAAFVELTAPHRRAVHLHAYRRRSTCASTAQPKIGEFFATQPAGGRLERIRHVQVRANRQPGLASYADEDSSGVYDAYGVMVFAIQGDRIAGITGFPCDTDLFSRFGLDATSR